MDDREWMYRRSRSGRMNPQYITGVRRFINFEYSIERNVSLGKIRCPCVKCKNQKFQKEDDVCNHLLRKGFLPYYKNWTVHGEPYDTDNMVGPSSGGISRVVNDEGDANPYRNMVLDAMRDDDAYYKARTSLNQQLARARNKAMSIIGTTNIIDCLDKGPVWIQNEDWNTMINDVWSTDRFCKRSKTSKQNRLKQTDGKISTHSGGSVSFASYRASMQEQAGGKELPWDEVFSALHQKSNETGTFVDNRSKIVVEKYRNEMVARYGPDQNNHPSFDGAAWCEASGGVSKGRVYGAPRMPKSKVDVSSSSHTYSVNSSYPSTTTTRRYEEQLQENREVINDMRNERRNEMSSIKDCLKLLVGHMGLSMLTPMAPSMPSPVAPSMPSPVAPSMPSPVAPSMPSPTMAPGYRPRPRPRPQPQMPYNGPSSSHQQHRRSFPP